MDETLNKLIEVIINGGAIGVAVAMIVYSAWKDRLHAKAEEKMYDKIGDSLEKMADAFAGTVHEIEKANTGYENLKAVLNSNAKAMGNYYKFIEETKDFFSEMKGFFRGLRENDEGNK